MATSFVVAVGTVGTVGALTTRVRYEDPIADALPAVVAGPPPGAESLHGGRDLDELLLLLLLLLCASLLRRCCLCLWGFFACSFFLLHFLHQKLADVSEGKVDVRLAVARRDAIKAAASNCEALNRVGGTPPLGHGLRPRHQSLSSSSVACCCCFFRAAAAAACASAAAAVVLVVAAAAAWKAAARDAGSECCRVGNAAAAAAAAWCLAAGHRALPEEHRGLVGPVAAAAGAAATS
mmetsp:Transcript_33564/g.72722  ORF Transcript_33564/g.72722 Transcript_33564/m.72722 type:complete len:236 (+) Transcript_33564:239-946(+)